MTAQKLGETVLVPGVTLSFGREAIFSGLRAIAVTACRRDPAARRIRIDRARLLFSCPARSAGRLG